MRFEEERRAVIAAALEMQTLGLVRGTSGNVSVRTADPGVIAVTPSSIPYRELAPEDICLLTPAGERVECSHAPSSESPMHLAIYAARPDVGAVVHTHSLYATVMASLCDVLPAVTVPGAEFYPVRSAPFAMPGTWELAETAAAYLGQNDAVLLAHHGLVCTGPTLAKALSAAGYVEENARIAYMLRTAGCREEIPAEMAKRIRENLKKGLAQ